MFGFFKSSNLKGYKVTDKERTKKYGVAANNLNDLIEKSAKKFDYKGCKLYLATDGTEVTEEDYFQSIPAQTLVEENDEAIDLKTDFDIIFDKFKAINSELLHSKELITQFLQDEKNQELLDVIQKVQSVHQEKIKCSNKEEDEDWFEGQDQKFTTKEQVMERKAQDRIRGYFYKTKEELTKSEIYKTDKSAKLLLDNLLDDFFLFLNGVDYFSCLFNRKCKNHYTNLLKSQDNIDGTIKRKIPPRKRIKLEVKKQLSNVDLFKKYSVTLCNKTGDFNCHGVWYDSKCSYSHSINPYASRENLIFFQTYNLDHQIEISRTILPSILENAKNLAKQENCSIHKKIGSSLSTITYFLEIFTMRNLKLVNIICHDKAIHQKRSKGRIICENCREFKFIEKIKREINSP